MAIVPKSRQGRGVAQVASAQLVQPEDPGLDGIAEGLGSVGDDLARAGLQIKQDNDQARATDLLTAAETEWQRALFNPEDGLLNRKGQDVMDSDEGPGVIAAGRSRRQEILEQHIGQAHNDTQRNALRAAWASRDRFANSTLQRHALGEISAYRDASDAAFIAERQNSLATVSAEERPIVEAEIRGKARQIAERRGLDPDIAKAMELQYLSPAYTNAILTMSETDPAAARELFEQKKEFVDAKEHTRIERALDQDMSTQEADSAFDAALGRLGKSATIAEYDEYISSISSGDAETKALRRVKRFVDSRDASQQQRLDDFEDDISSGIRSYFRTNPDGEAVSAERDALEGRAIRFGLPEERTDALLELFDKLAEGPEVRTDHALFNDILTNPAPYVNQPMSERASRLSESDLETANKRIREFQLDPSGGETKSNMDPLLNAFARHKIHDKTSGQKALRGELILAYLNELGAEAQTGPVPAQRKLEIAERIIANRIDSDWIGADDFIPSGPVGEEEITENTRDLWALAYHRASNGGRLTPSDDQIRANYQAIREEPARIKESQGNDAAVSHADALRQQGREARILLHERGSPWAKRVDGRAAWQARADREAAARAAQEEILLEDIDELLNVIDASSGGAL